MSYFGIKLCAKAEYSVEGAYVNLRTLLDYISYKVFYIDYQNLHLYELSS